MVRRKQLYTTYFIVFTVLFIHVTAIPLALGQGTITYSVSQEWVQIWINKEDGSIDMLYNITMTYLSGEPEGIVTLGMPKSGFQISYVKDDKGNALSYEITSQGSFYGIDVSLRKPIILNSPNTILVYAIIPEMVLEDNTNPGNAGMLFYPTTFASAVGPLGDVRVKIVLPEGVTEDDVKYLKEREFNNVMMEGSNVAVYWEEMSWPTDQEFTVGVSFPVKYVTLPGPNIWFYLIIAFVVLGSVAALIILINLLRRKRKATYEKPKVSIEALGAARGLTAVEAAVVVGSKPIKILTMILFGMLKKRYLMVKETTPLIKVEQVDTNLRDPSPPRYYEIDYLRAVESDGSLNEMRLARTLLSLRDNVDRKMRSYSRVDTVNYYKSVVDKAWEQVTQAGTPELKGDAVEQNMEWLLIDENYDSKFKQAFPPNIVILPNPSWWWYWYGPYLPRGPATPQSSRTPTEVKPIPAQEWANNVVLGLETATNNIVKNVQDFSNRLIGDAHTPSSRSVRQGSSCVCACAHCACACACVGCACACAGGGAR